MTDKPLEKPSTFSLVMNLVPVLNLALGGAAVLTAPAGVRLPVALAWLLLLPPLTCRLVLALLGEPQGRLMQDTRGYKVWWFLTQLQMVFNRLPWLEDAMRLVPGLYAGWIRLWGGRLSARTYVAPGVVIVDRYLIEVREGAVLGFASVLAPHLGTRDENGRYVVLVGRIVVEEEAIIGGQTGLGPGAVVRRGAVLPAARHVGPFGQWPRRPGSDPE